MTRIGFARKDIATIEEMERRRLEVVQIAQHLSKRLDECASGDRARIRERIVEYDTINRLLSAAIRGRKILDEMVSTRQKVLLREGAPVTSVTG